MALLRRLFPGRLASNQQTDIESRDPVGNNAAARRAGGPLDGLLSDAAEPGGEQHSRRGGFRGHRARAGKAAASLADSWFGGWGPHIGVAYSLTPKTVIRSSFSRSFAVITTVTGSTHNQGFSTNPGFSTQDNGVSPAFLLSGSFPAFPLPPFISPSGSNGLAIPVVSESGGAAHARIRQLESLDSAPAVGIGGARLSPTTDRSARTCRAPC